MRNHVTVTQGRGLEKADSSWRTQISLYCTHVTKFVISCLVTWAEQKTTDRESNKAEWSGWMKEDHYIK